MYVYKEKCDTYIYHIFLIYLSVVHNLGCFHNLAIVYDATINIHARVSLSHSDLQSFRYKHRNYIAGYFGPLLLVF
jgi:hypothetical protein